jgi:preprotein translocase subunit SecY
VDDLGWKFRIVTVVSLTPGTLVFDVAWAIKLPSAELATAFRSSSLLELSRVCPQPWQAWKTFVPQRKREQARCNPAVLVLMVAFLFIVIAAVIAITKGVRKDHCAVRKRVVGRKMYGGPDTVHAFESELRRCDANHLSLGATSLPATIVQYGFQRTAHSREDRRRAFQRLAALRRARGNDFLLQLFLGRHAVSTDQIADDLKKYGGYIPGVRPGKPTADFLDYHHDAPDFRRRDLFTLIAGVPSLLSQWLNVPVITAQFFGGTSLLIIVGVMLDTMRQVETHLIQRHYDGFLRKGESAGARSIALPTRAAKRRRAAPDVAVCGHCGARDCWGRDLSLRAIGEKAACSSRPARFRQRNSGGNDYAALRNSRDFAGAILRRERDLGHPLGQETAGSAPERRTRSRTRSSSN